ncbi:MAG: APC family permease [Gemmatimonadales bacterium]
MRGARYYSADVWVSATKPEPDQQPENTAHRVYLRDTFGPLPAFLYGWALLLVITSGAIAAVDKTFAGYFLSLTDLSQDLMVPVPVAAIVLLAGINYVGVKRAAVTQNIFTLLKLAALAALIVVGLALSGPALHQAPAVAAPPLNWSGVVVAIGAALVPILFTYGGWQQTNFIAGEIIEPERNLPRALVLGVCGVVAVYLLANIAYLRVLGTAGLAASTAPAADVMRGLLGPVGATVIAAGIAVSTFGFLNLVILVTPQSFTALVDYVAFGDWIFFGLAAAALFVYRARDAAAGAPGPAFQVPGYPWTPACFVLAAAYVVASSIGANPKNAAIGSGLILFGVPVYAFWNTRRRDGETARRQGRRQAAEPLSGCEA